MASRRRCNHGSGWTVLVCLVLGFSWTGCGGSAVSDIDDGEGASEPVEPGAPPGSVPDFAMYPDVGTEGETSEDGIAKLNEYRILAGLEPVVVDGTWSAACLGHLKYLDHLSVHNHGGECVLSHEELDVTNPYYAPLHDRAAAGALLACERNASGSLRPGRAVDRWINSLYHRLPLLHPGLARVGGAAYRGFVCFHYDSGTLPIDEPQRVVWPPDRTVDVPRSFVGRERPCPTNPSDPDGTAAVSCPSSGFILTATWYGPEGGYPYGPAVAEPTLRRVDDGASVPLLAWYADGVTGHDPAEGLIPRTVAWVPSAPLSAGMRYEAHLAGSGWTFRTGTRME